MENKDINAAWAHSIAMTKLGEIAKKQLEEYLNKIKEAATSNKLSIVVINLEDVNKRELEIRGFKIQYNSPDSRDQRECSSYTISW